MTNLGASIGTALAGAVLISALSTSFFTGIKDNSAVPASVASKAQTELSSGVPFVSDAQLKEALDKADVPDCDGRCHREGERGRPDQPGCASSLAVLAVVGLLALFFSRRLPSRQPAAAPTEAGSD